MRYQMIPFGGRSRPERPSHSECSGKIKRFRELVEAGKWKPASPAKLKADFDELERDYGVDTTLVEDQRKILLQCIDEIQPEDYDGHHPPQRSDEPTAKNLEMFAFCWESPSFKNDSMYLKFCFTKAGPDQIAFVFSVHPSREA
jgi:hypothetical protein